VTGQEILSLFGNEFVKLLVSGILGGLTAHFMSIRLFGIQRKVETRREFQLKRLDALRDLRLTLHWLRRDITYNWEKPMKKDQTPEEYMFELMNKFNYWETLFLHDQQMSNTLRKFYSLIGASHEAFYGNNKIFPKPLGEIIIEIRSEVELKIVEIEKSITK
jgi:hypothetical protein